MLTFGSLFSDIGGFDLGLERAGMTCAWQVEIDDYCCRVLAKHWPHVPRFEDVHHVGHHNLCAVDLIAGGFPCQPHSLAGKRRGADDDRNLWPEMRRIVGELRPRWVIAENVPGIRTTILDQVLFDLEAKGYTTGTLDIPAVAFDAWHRRNRIFVVAYRNGDRCGNGTYESVGFPQRSNAPDAGNDGTPQTLAHLDRGRSEWRADEQIGQPQERIAVGRDGAHHADPDGRGRNGPQVAARQQAAHETHAYPGGKVAANGNEPGLAQRQGQHKNNGAQRPAPIGASRWAPEPELARVVHGVPNRVDRIRGLGNAVVPQVAEWLGQYVLDVDITRTNTT